MRRILINSDNSEPLVKIYWGGKGGEKQKVSERFSFSNVNYNLRSGSQFHQPSANTVWNGQETTSYLGPKIWNMVPEEMKQKSSLFAFKREIKQWVPDNCPCRICKNYLPNIGLI